MKGLLFFLVLLGVIIVAWSFSTKEGFQDKVPAVDPGLNIPLISPRYQTLVQGTVQPFSPPSTSLLAPPPGQTASVNTRPDSDPAMQKVTAERIQSIYESIVGFFANDAPGLQKIGDPSIQLPLTTTRGDRTRLKDELDTLKRNPGLESSLTTEDVDGIQANLGYLQKKWRMSTNALSGSPMEGFQSGGNSGYDFGSGSGSGSAVTIDFQQAAPQLSASMLATAQLPMPQIIGNGSGSGLTMAAQMANPPMAPQMAPQIAALMATPQMAAAQMAPQMADPQMAAAQMAPQMAAAQTMDNGSGLVYSSASSYTSGSALNVPSASVTADSRQAGNQTVSPTIPPPTFVGSGSGSGSGSDVTLQDLLDLSMKIGVEIIRLKSSGAADSFVDMNLQSRINTLLSIKKAVDDMIAEVRSGARKLKDIPLTKAEIAAFLPAMANPNTALPKLIKESGASNYLNSLFPTFAAGDISGAILAQKLFNKYEDQLINNLSWDVSLHYTSKAEQQVAADNAITAGTYGYMPEDGTSPYISADKKGYRGFLDSLVHKMGGKHGKHGKDGKDGQGDDDHQGGYTRPNEPSSLPGNPGSLDWKDRSKQICAQIKAREYNPYDFGCLQNPDAMNRESFSWRGYTKMICNRLSTVYDSSVPELCGCPPTDWCGWRQ